MESAEKALYPRESAKFIASRSKDVRINLQAVEKAAVVIFDCLKTKKYSLKNWKEHELHPKEMCEASVDWIFVLDTLNFSFWSDGEEEEQFVIGYKGGRYTGYWGLCAALNRALEEGVPITTPSFYAGITEEQLRHIFRSESSTEMPLLQERVKNLREVGKILVEKYNNSFANVIKECNRSVKNLLEIVTTNFPCFNDVGVFEGVGVSFLKRAQILVADIWGCFEGKSYGEFHDIEYLTMFADYRVPQALLHLQIFEYSESLMERLKRREIMHPGDRHEMEIRGCSIWAVELIYLRLQTLIQEAPELEISARELPNFLNSVIIDFYLWDFATVNKEKMSEHPFHRVRSIFY